MSDERRCDCCDLSHVERVAECGHAFCYLCVGRGHDLDCAVCAYPPPTPHTEETDP